MLWTEAQIAPGTLQLRWQAWLIQHLGAAVSLSQHGQRLNATFHHCTLSDLLFLGPFLLNHLLIAQHFPMWVHIPSLFQISRTTQIQVGRTVSEEEQSLTPRLHTTNFEIRLPPRFTQTALVRARVGVARQLKTLAADWNVSLIQEKILYNALKGIHFASS